MLSTTQNIDSNISVKDLENLVMSTNNNPSVLDTIRSTNFDWVKYWSDNGSSLLHKVVENAATCSSTATLQFLIETGANVNSVEGTGSTTPLMYASALSSTKNNIQCVKLLIGAKADVNIQSNPGTTALHLASSFWNTTSNADTIKLLIDANADPDIQNSRGYTALHNIFMDAYCSDKINIDYLCSIIKLLTAANCSIDIQNNQGVSPLQYALRIPNPTIRNRVVNMLVEARNKKSKQ